MTTCSASRERTRPTYLAFGVTLIALGTFGAVACGGGDATAPTSAIQGTVIDDLSAPVPGLPVDLGRAGGGETLGETETAEDGTYSFTVDPGTYEVRLRLPERFALLGPSNPQSVSVEGGATGSADFRLRLRAGAVVGTVADTTGAALAGITAALRLSSGGELTTETDGSGAFRFDRASIGVQSLFISITDGAVVGPNPINVTVTEDRTVDVEFTAVLFPPGIGSWETLAPLPTPRTENSVVALDGFIYVVGGLGDGRAELAVERYDPATDTWATVTSLPGGVDHAGLVTVDGLIYVVGGYVGFRGIDTLRIYDPAIGSWSLGAPLPTARGGLGVAVLDGKIHAIGGSEDNVEGMVVHEVYDPATDSWSSRAPMSDPRHHLAAAALDGRIYAAAGREFGTNVGTLEIYDPDTDSWSGGPAVPTPRSGVAAVSLGGTFFLFGGEGFNPDRTFAQTEQFIPVGASTGVWRRLASMPTARHGLGAAVVDGSIYVIAGGPEARVVPSDINERFTPP